MPSDKLSLLITAKGEDAPGITSSLTSIIAEAEVEIFDIEQVVIHNLLTLSILVELNEKEKKPLLSDLLYRSRELNLDLDFRLITDQDTIINRSPVNTYVITCLGDHIPTKAIASIADTLFKNSMNIEKVGKLAWGQLCCLEISASAQRQISPKELTGHLLDISHENNIDIAVQLESIYRKSKRMVFIDMDSTLIQVEVIDELAALAGVKDKVEAITERAMNGEMDFQKSLMERVALLKGLTIEDLSTVYNSILLTQGAENLIKALKQLGYKTAVISGGFDYFTERFKQRLGLDYAFSNRLEIVDGRLTGKVVGKIVDGARKARLLEKICNREGISTDQVIAIGDGANDLPMLGKAGLGIAFNAKKVVREAADYSISHHSLDSILYLLGIKESDLKEMKLREV